MSRISADVAEVLRTGLLDPAVVSRYWAFVTPPTAQGCRLWTGAVSGRGHARFWVGRRPDGRDAVVLGHRFAWGLRHGYDHLAQVATVRHYRCDNPLCQNTEHLRAGTNADNAHDWSTRRTTVGSPLRDTRGSLGRALAIRAAARASTIPADAEASGAWAVELVTAAADAGLSQLDRDQPPLLALPG